MIPHTERRTWIKILRNIIISLLILFMIFTFILQKQQISRLEQTMLTAELRLTNYNSFYPIFYGFELVKEEPTKERFEMLYATLQNQHHFIEGLIELNKHKLSEEQWSLYNEKPGQQATIYLLNIAKKVDDLSADDWNRIEAIEKVWLTFAKRANQAIDLGNVDTVGLAYYYTELQKQLYAIRNIEDVREEANKK